MLYWFDVDIYFNPTSCTIRFKYARIKQTHRNFMQVMRISIQIGLKFMNCVKMFLSKLVSSIIMIGFVFDKICYIFPLRKTQPVHPYL